MKYKKEKKRLVDLFNWSVVVIEYSTLILLLCNREGITRQF